MINKLPTGIVVLAVDALHFVAPRHCRNAAQQFSKAIAPRS